MEKDLSANTEGSGAQGQEGSVAIGAGRDVHGGIRTGGRDEEGS